MWWTLLNWNIWKMILGPHGMTFLQVHLLLLMKHIYEQNMFITAGISLYKLPIVSTSDKGGAHQRYCKFRFPPEILDTLTTAEGHSKLLSTLLDLSKMASNPSFMLNANYTWFSNSQLTLASPLAIMQPLAILKSNVSFHKLQHAILPADLEEIAAIYQHGSHWRQHMGEILEFQERTCFILEPEENANLE